MQEIKKYVEEKKERLHETAKSMGLSVAIVQVGHAQASDRYVKNKIKDLAQVGIPCELVSLPESVSEKKLLKTIGKLNKSRKVSGFIVQLPLPNGISEEKVKLAIDPKKDIDGFHPLNTKIAAATPAGILMYLEDQKFDFEGKNAVVIGRSNIVGKPMHNLLLKKNMNVIMLHTRTSDTDKRFYLKHADLIVVASGHRNTLTKDYALKKSAVVIDVGINVNEDGKLCGDCEKELPVAFQSPVPGGVGLLTRLALIKNLIELNS